MPEMPLPSISNETIFNAIDISDEVMVIFSLVAMCGVCQTLAVFGVVANIINIACFIKQGFREPVNISLLGLAVADLGSLMTQMCMNLLYTLPVITANDTSFDPMDVTYLAFAMPHLAFSRVNILITVIITLERCLCITIPLKMNHIVTPRRVWILIVCVYVVFIFSGSPVYAVNRLGTKFSPTKNRTLLGLVSTIDKDIVEGITFTINSFFLPFVAFIIIIICTVILVVSLRKRTKWLKTSSTSTTAKSDVSTRDQKVAKMVVMIAVLFIVCFVPLAAIMLAVVFEPNLNLGGALFNIGKVLGTIVLLMESVNSSANIFIYHHMSKNYRDTFTAMFLRDKYKTWAKE